MQTMPSAPTSAAQGQGAQPRYEITEDDKKRQQRIADAWRAYDGLLDPPLKAMPGQPDDNVLSNRCQAIADRGVDFLFGKKLEISVEDGAPQEAQDTLDTVWGRKEQRMPLLQELAMNGAMAGCAFLRIAPEASNVFRLVTVDPSTVFMQSAPQDCETILLYCIEYSTSEKINGKPTQVFYREEIARIDPDSDGDDGNPFADTDATWEIQHWSRIGDRGPWTASGAPIAWPYSFPPLFHCKNLPRPNTPWGTPDITPDLIGINEALNLVQSNINRIYKIYGAPLLAASGVAESYLDIQPGRIHGLPSPDSKMWAVTITADVANGLTFAADLRSDIDEQSSVPGVATGRIKDMPRGAVSGVAIELMFMPILKKTDKKRCTYGELIIDVSKALLVLSHMSGDIDVTLAWQNPLPHDDLQSAQTAAVLQGIGISNTTLQRELGYDPDEEQQLSQSEDAQKLVAFSRGQGMAPPMQGQPGAPPMPTQQQGQQGESPFLGGGR